MQAALRLATVLAILAAFAGKSSAQISLSSAVDLALRNDPRVKVGQAEVNKAAAALAQTRDVYLPTASVDGGYGQGLGVPTGLPTVFSFSSQSLLFNFSQRDNIRAAVAALDSARFALRDTHDQVAEDAVVTYLNLDNDQRRQTAMNQEFEFADRWVNIVQDRVDAGQDTRTSLLRARRTAKQIELDKLQLADDIAALSAHLSHLIGFPITSFTAVSDSIPALPSIASLVESTTPSGQTDAFVLESADANARSKQELAFGEHRYLLRPQISLAVNYSRIDTGQNDYTTYYPSFKSKSENAASVYFQITIPIYDRRHQEESREASAEASRATFEAAVQRTQFLESRFKLQHSATELATRAELAEIDRDLAEEQLNSTLIQLQSGAQPNGAAVMTPEDEQNARLQERQRYIELLSTQFELQQAQVNLLRQTGVLDDWLKSALAAPATPSPSLQTAPPTAQ